MKRDEIDEGEFYNSTCLQFDPENVKAHYRKIQIHIARGELKEAQEYAISCTSRFKNQDEKTLKPFKEILLGEIAEKIRAKLDKHNSEQDLTDMENMIVESVTKQIQISAADVDKYAALINSFKGAQKFPSTLTSVAFNTLLMNGKYDDDVTIPLLERTRFNRPFKTAILIDVFRHYLIDGILSDDTGDKNDYVIGEDKVTRKGVICAIFSNLIKITDVKFIRVMLKHFLINDYDKVMANNPCNFIFVLS